MEVEVGGEASFSRRKAERTMTQEGGGAEPASDRQKKKGKDVQRLAVALAQRTTKNKENVSESTKERKVKRQRKVKRTN